MYSGEGANGRNPAIEQMLKLISPQGLSPQEAKEQYKCPLCGKSIDPDKDFKDGLSVKEWTISGMCQEDQDKVFTPPEA